MSNTWATRALMGAPCLSTRPPSPPVQPGLVRVWTPFAILALPLVSPRRSGDQQDRWFETRLCTPAADTPPGAMVRTNSEVPHRTVRRLGVVSFIIFLVAGGGGDPSLIACNAVL